MQICTILNEHGLKKKQIATGLIIGKGDKVEDVFDIVDVAESLGADCHTIDHKDKSLTYMEVGGEDEGFFVHTQISNGHERHILNKPRTKNVFVRLSGLVKLMMDAPETEAKKKLSRLLLDCSGVVSWPR